MVIGRILGVTHHNRSSGVVILPRYVVVPKIILAGFPGPRPETGLVSYVLRGGGRSVLRPQRSVLRMSPRPGPRRPTLTFRLTPEAIHRIDLLAEAENVQRSEMLRRMLAYAARHMPKGWQQP